MQTNQKKYHLDTPTDALRDAVNVAPIEGLESGADAIVGIIDILDGFEGTASPAPETLDGPTNDWREFNVD